jgi:ABC-type hemin transport system ATPase subunit
MSDRILVMHEGRVTAELSRAEATEEQVMFAATGQQVGAYHAPAGGDSRANNRQNGGAHG